MIFAFEVQNLKFSFFKSKVFSKAARFAFEQILVLLTKKHFAFEQIVVILNKGFCIFLKDFLLGTEVFFKSVFF